MYIVIKKSNEIIYSQLSVNCSVLPTSANNTKMSSVLEISPCQLSRGNTARYEPSVAQSVSMRQDLLWLQGQERPGSLTGTVIQKVDALAQIDSKASSEKSIPQNCA